MQQKKKNFFILKENREINFLDILRADKSVEESQTTQLKNKGNNMQFVEIEICLNEKG